LWSPEADIGAGVDVDFVVGRATVREIQCARNPVCERSSGRHDSGGASSSSTSRCLNALLQRPVQVCESYPFFSGPGCCSLGSFGVELRILKSSCLSNI
jgi:hypothetical protein